MPGRSFQRPNHGGNQMDAQYTNGQSRDGQSLVERAMPPVGRHNGHGQAARGSGRTRTAARSVREGEAMTRKVTAKKVAATPRSRDLDERQKDKLRAAAEALAAENNAPLPEGDACLIEAER